MKVVEVFEVEEGELFFDNRERKFYVLIAKPAPGVDGMAFAREAANPRAEYVEFDLYDEVIV